MSGPGGSRRRRRIAAAAASLVFMALLSVLSLSQGSAQLPPGRAFSAVADRILPGRLPDDRLADTIVWRLRLPRLVMAILCGGVLGLAGCATQAALRNPLATPFMLGVSAAAGFGASLAVIAGAGWAAGRALIVGNAFAVSLVPGLVILLLARRGEASPETMILAGVAMSYLFGAANTILQYFAESDAVKVTVFWLVGDLSRSAWWQVPYIAAALLLAAAVFVWKAWDLQIMKMGDEQAQALGVAPERVRRIVLLASCLVTAAVVSFTGAIGFVCLVAPHLSRFWSGGDERFLIPLSGLSGANLLLLADILARRAAAPVVLPVGAVTALIGGPVLVALLVRRKRARTTGADDGR